MPPTDCFDGAEACSASLACVPEPRAGHLPTTRSPLHHGTDPDLSAPTPLPAGVAAVGLDLSPISDGTCGMVSMAKRKQRCPGGHMSPQSGRIFRGYRPGTKAESQAKRAATVVHEGDALPSAVVVSPRKQTPHDGSPNSVSAVGAESSTLGATVPLPAGESVRSAPPEMSRDSLELRHPGEGAHVGDVSAIGEARTTMTIPLSPERELCDGGAPPALAPLVRGVTVAVRERADASAVGDGRGSRSVTAPGVTAPGDDSKNERQKELELMITRARIASDHIRLLLHAKRCEGGNCKESGCASARQLVNHMRGCHGPCINAKCAQAKRMLQHYSECNRRRFLGGRYCLVCSLVARSATNGNGSRANSNTASFGANSPLQPRQPLGNLSTGVAPTRDPNACALRDNAGSSAGVAAGGLQSPVAISRLARADCTYGPPSVSSSAGRRVSTGRPTKDGVFFRPYPKARSGSWGGYDRRRCLRRTRFDSIPEELAEEDGEEDDLEEETSSEGGSKSSEDNRSKTFVSSLSL